MNLDLIDAVSNIFAFIGCAAYGISAMRYRHFDALSRRIGWLMSVAALVFLTRFFIQVTDAELAYRLLRFLSLGLPFFILLTAESFLRRHAALWLKIWVFVALLAGVFFLGIPVEASEPAASILAAAALLVTCFACAAWIRGRYKTDLLAAEHAAAKIYAVALFILGPLILGDFAVLTGLDVRFGAAGVLIGLFILFRTTIDHTTVKQTFFEIGLMFVFALPIAVIGMDEDRSGILMTGLIVMSLSMFASLGLTSRVVAAFSDTSRIKRLQEMLKIDTRSVDGFLQSLKTIYDVRALDKTDMDIYDIHHLTENLGDTPVVSKKHLGRRAGLDIALREQLEHMFAAHGGTHAVFLNGAVPHVLLFNMPALDHEEDTLARLEMVHKLAWPVTQQGAQA